MIQRVPHPALATHQGEIVLRDIDSGLECEFWLLPMSAAELEHWWRTQPTFDSNPDGAFDSLYTAFGETPPPHSKRDLPGTFLGADPDLWVQMAASGRHYFCSICCDYDSLLRRPDGTYVYHRGYQGTRAA